VFDNYFQTDAFTQFIIGENEGRALISEWLNEKSNESNESNESIASKMFVINDLRDDLRRAGFQFSDKILTRFISSLLSKPFVILTGLSGSGKTKLAQAFASWISEDEKQYCIVPVGADWTSREPLLGYENALDHEQYVVPENGALKLMIEAVKDPDKPYFLILDEMNLSHVERYFADFLSVMESGEPIRLHPGEDEKSGVPPEITWPHNLFVVGTVNIDETTYMFSPKVLDRANVIEFRVKREEIEEFLNSGLKTDMERLRGGGSSMSGSFLSILSEGNDKYAESDSVHINSILLGFFDELRKTGTEFGYRTANEIKKLIYFLSELDKELSDDEKSDIAVMQKLLPKLHGSRRKLVPVLETLGSLCLKEGSDIRTDFFDADKDINYDNDVRVKFPLTLEKVTRMYRSAVDNGFASYAEA
jgi:5-methylcytosine-specific restriction protein B